MIVVTSGCFTTFETITKNFSSQNGLKFNKNYFRNVLVYKNQFMKTKIILRPCGFEPLNPVVH